ERCSAPGGRQLDHEPRAAALAVLVPELAACVGNDLPRQAEPQPAGGIVGRGTLVQPGEWLEQFALPRSGNPRAAVFGHQLQVAGRAAPAADLEVAVRGVLER